MRLNLSGLLIILQANAPVNAPVMEPKDEEVYPPSQAIEDCEEGVKGLMEGVVGLEFFLKDKKAKKENCPSIVWEQPSLEEYKKEPKSYLPESCKVED